MLGKTSANSIPISNQDKTITENGTYTADEGFTGLGTINVEVNTVNNVPLTVNQNGTYELSEHDNYSGYNPIVVDVLMNGESIQARNITNKTISKNEQCFVNYSSTHYTLDSNIMANTYLTPSFTYGLALVDTGSWSKKYSLYNVETGELEELEYSSYGSAPYHYSSENSISVQHNNGFIKLFDDGHYYEITATSWVGDDYYTHTNPETYEQELVKVDPETGNITDVFTGSFGWNTLVEYENIFFKISDDNPTMIQTYEIVNNNELTNTGEYPIEGNVTTNPAFDTMTLDGKFFISTSGQLQLIERISDSQFRYWDANDLPNAAPYMSENFYGNIYFNKLTGDLFILGNFTENAHFRYRDGCWETLSLNSGMPIYFDAPRFIACHKNNSNTIAMTSNNNGFMGNFSNDPIYNVITNEELLGVDIFTTFPFTQAEAQEDISTYFSGEVLVGVSININEVNNQPSLTVTANGSYTPSQEYTGLSEVVVNVPEPQLATLEVTENNTYIPESPYVGYSSVTVNVPSSGGGATLTATNKTGSAITAGDKVWLNENVQEAGSRFYIQQSTTPQGSTKGTGYIFPDGQGAYSANSGYYSITSDSSTLIDTSGNTRYAAGIWYSNDGKLIATTTDTFIKTNRLFCRDFNANWITSDLYSSGNYYINTFCGDNGSGVGFAINYTYKYWVSFNLEDGTIIAVNQSTQSYQGTAAFLGNGIYAITSTSEYKKYFTYNFDTNTWGGSGITYTQTGNSSAFVNSSSIVGITSDYRYVIIRNDSDWDNPANLRMIEKISNTELKGLTLEEMPADIQDCYSVNTCIANFNPKNGILTVIKRPASGEAPVFVVLKYENGTWTKLNIGGINFSPLSNPSNNFVPSYYSLTFSEDMSRACMIQWAGYPIIYNLTSLSGYNAFTYKPVLISAETQTGYAAENAEVEAEFTVNVAGQDIITPDIPNEPTTTILEIDPSKVTLPNNVEVMSRYETDNITVVSGFNSEGLSILEPLPKFGSVSLDDPDMADEFVFTYRMYPIGENTLLNNTHILTPSTDSTIWSFVLFNSGTPASDSFNHGVILYKKVGTSQLTNLAKIDFSNYDLGGGNAYWHSVSLKQDTNDGIWKFSNLYNATDPTFVKTFYSTSYANIDIDFDLQQMFSNHAGTNMNLEIDLAETGFRRNGEWIWRAVKEIEVQPDIPEEPSVPVVEFDDTKASLVGMLLTDNGNGSNVMATYTNEEGVTPYLTFQGDAPSMRTPTTEGDNIADQIQFKLWSLIPEDESKITLFSSSNEEADHFIRLEVHRTPNSETQNYIALTDEYTNSEGIKVKEPLATAMNIDTIFSQDTDWWVHISIYKTPEGYWSLGVVNSVSSYGCEINTELQDTWGKDLSAIAPHKLMVPQQFPCYFGLDLYETGFAKDGMFIWQAVK